jgi:hypothetical protein
MAWAWVLVRTDRSLIRALSVSRYREVLKVAALKLLVAETGVVVTLICAVAKVMLAPS